MGLRGRFRTLPWALVCLLALAATGCSVSPPLAVRQVEDDFSSQLVRGIVQERQALARELSAQDDLALARDAADLVRQLDTNQRVAQLFFVTPESLLAGRYDDVVVASGDLTREALLERPVGGIIYFQQNLVDAEQTKAMLAGARAYSLEACGIPTLLGVDEEGGTVSRISGNPGFAIENVGDMSAVGSTGDDAYAEDVASHIGSYLRELGFSADFAPVADIANNPDSATMALRSFGSDAALVARMTSAQVRGFAAARMICCAKHFPGIGGAEGDSHTGAIYTYENEDEMLAEELVPFAAAIEAGVPMVMVGHLSCPTITGNDLPASVCPEVMGHLLRERLDFEGVVVTDSLGMGAIVERFGYDRVAVEAFLAGADALLMPADFDAAYRGMLDAVASGEVTQERLDLSVWRIVRMKLAAERS